MQDEEQKNLVIEKKEIQKIEDDAEKCEKHIDSYITKQMAMLMSGDQLKDMGYDKFNAQAKTNLFLQIVGNTMVQARIKAMVKYVSSVPLFSELEPNLMQEEARQLIDLEDQNMMYGPFDRLNEPLVLTLVHKVQRHWDYDHFKYTKPRDPSID